MERREYAKLNEIEGEMWWFRALHANLASAFRRRAPAPTGHRTLLDAGCGTGGLLTRLAVELPGWNVFGLDADGGACAAARAKSGRAICVGSANAMPFADASLDAIVSADVLCHRNIEERRTLGQFHRCLAAGGLLVLNLPAYDWLLSSHDRAVHNVRRYTRRRLSTMLEAAGFAGIKTSYWNMLLFPLMAARRAFWRGRTASSDVMLYPAPLEAAFRAVMRIEATLLKHGLTLPFGGSILATAIKP
ncbi:MAG: methyltransferase domain-containing protein [Alphaproteobacteria bacterium]|nr:methyltransferase domain-containing protein [Alphaproteobacteria bacterium]